MLNLYYVYDVDVCIGEVVASSKENAYKVARIKFGLRRDSRVYCEYRGVYNYHI